MKNITSVILAIFLYQTTYAQSFESYLSINSLKVHYSVYTPSSKIVGQILFLHGYGDNSKNHKPLFDKFNESGIEVIAFDYPSHGKTTGELCDDLNSQTFGSLTEIAVRILQDTQKDVPLVLAGWSTGGLHATRIAQVPDWKIHFKNLKGLILFAPGVSVQKCVGGLFCNITNSTLNHNPALQNREITPISPLLRPVFASHLLWNAYESWSDSLPIDIPVMVFMASDSDKYVKTNNIKLWIQEKRKNQGAKIISFQCPKAYHEIDNETIQFGGPFVRFEAASFAESVFTNKPYVPAKSSDICHRF